MVDNTGNVLLGTNFTSKPLETWELNWMNRTRLSIYVSCVWCMYMHLFACSHVVMWSHACMWMWMSPMSLLITFNSVSSVNACMDAMDVFLDYFPSCFVTGSLNLEFIKCLDWLASELQGSACLWFCNDGVTEVCFYPTFKWILDAGILNSARLTDWAISPAW